MIHHEKLLEIAIKAALDAGEATKKFYQQEFDVMVKEDNSPLTLADLESNRIILENLNETRIPVLSEENKLVPYAVRRGWDLFWLVDPLDGTKEFINKSAEYTVNIALIEKGLPIIGVVYAPILKIIYFGLNRMGSFKTHPLTGYIVKDIIKRAVRLEISNLPAKVRVVASKSHINAETDEFIKKLGERVCIGEMNSYGSSLKICMIAGGEADIYPRIGPTMEWDTAAGHAIVLYAGYTVLNLESRGSLQYNKENLLNPYFAVYNPALEAAVSAIIR